jgi:hypothetical protein
MALPILYYANGTAFGSNIFGNELLPFSGTTGDYQVKGVNGEYYSWTGYIPDDPFPRLLSTSLWQYKRVPYPASGIAMAYSIKVGIDWVVSEVLKTDPGTAYSVGGYSQGACVAAGVVKETLGSGRLASRAGDLRACVTFGNPIREVNHTFPGSSGYSGAVDIPGSTRGGHGLFPANLRMQNTPSYMYDFVMPQEIITCVGDSFPDGQFIQNWVGGAITPALTAVPTLLGFAAFLVLAGRFAVAPASIARNAANLAQAVVTNPITGATAFLDGGGHVLYPFFPPPNADGTIPSSGDTCYQIAARYLNQVGAAIYDEMHPTVPAPTVKSTYQWFTTLPNG